MPKSVRGVWDDILLAMSLDEVKWEAASYRDMYNTYRVLDSVGINPIKADSAHQSMVDRQARIFMFEQGLSFEDCHRCECGKIVTGFHDPTLDGLFRIAA